MATVKKLVVTAALHECCIDSALTKLLDGTITRSQIKNLLDEGRILLDETLVTKSSLLVKENQVITLEIPDPKELDLKAVDLKLEIVFEDEHLAIVNKPQGLSVHPSDTEDGPTLVHGLLHALDSLSSVGGVARPGIVHRIDKGTSGLLVISKSDVAHQGLSTQFKEHTIDRIYYAYVYGDIGKKKNAGRIETFFGRHLTNRKKMTGTLQSGRTAITNWWCEKTYKNISLVKCKLETGRTHQIRVHLAEMGFPIVGDPLYGHHEKQVQQIIKKNVALGQALKPLEYQMLHAKSLGFTHPVTKEKLYFECPFPDSMKKITEILENHG